MIKAIVAATIFTASHAIATEVTIKVEGVKDRVGKVAALLFADGNGFPNETAKAAHKIQVDAKPGTTEIKVAGLKPGRYAVCVIHDENQNALLDRNFLGMPKEPIAFSVISEIPKGKPDFAACSFEIKDADLAMTIPLVLK